MPLKHAAGMGQHLMKAPQRMCRLVQHLHLCHDLVLIGQGLVGLNVMPELDRAGEHHLSPLEGQPKVHDFSLEGGGLFQFSDGVFNMMLFHRSFLVGTGTDSTYLSNPGLRLAHLPSGERPRRSMAQATSYSGATDPGDLATKRGRVRE